MLVLVLLGVVWVVALSPMILRKLRDREPHGSISTFTHHLSRLATPSPRTTIGSSVSGSAIGFSAAARRIADDRFAGSFGSDAGSVTFAGIKRRPRPEPLVSRTTTIRRRRVILLLCLAAVFAGLVGIAVPSFFFVAVGVGGALLCYFALLAYFHQLAMERAQKVVALETRREVAQALDVARHQNAAIPSSCRVRGSGWSIPDDELEGDELVSAGR